ncbi:MAG: hypothetical protein EOM91_13920 [Sphingobacteriia bacterium]|jgi:PRTRC genetic system protein C|nr:hypothetical protein [Sphingobacteriia bacterium]
MTLHIAQPIRKFSLGALELDDPAPDLDPEAALALYAPNFPQLQGAVLSAPQMRADGVLLYAVERPPVKTKG